MIPSSRFVQADLRGLPRVDAAEIDDAVNPLRLSDSPARSDPIPSLGEDTEPILRELGYGDADIENLRRDKVI